ncbi:SufD family Fe-S cluster assembly protein [bacterium]|nr:SufD family Fe-S cluster assembly protein [bacterium]
MITLENDVFLRLNPNGSNLVIDEGHRATYIYESDIEKASTPLDIYVAKNASLKLFGIIDSKLEDNLDISISLRENSFCKIFLLNLGQSLSINIRTELLEERACIDIKVMHILVEEKEFKLDISQKHLASYSKSNLIVKGILKDKSRMSFKGNINIEKKAEKVSAYQINRTLILEDGPMVESIPILEIENDNVELCSHGSAIGRIDEEELFYLESRGLDKKIAVKMLSVAFLQDLLDELFTDVPFLKNSVTGQLEDIFKE